MKKLYWKQLQGALDGFSHAAIKEVTNGYRAHRTVVRTLQLHDSRILSCWTNDPEFIRHNDNRALPIIARFINNETGVFVVCKGESTLVALSPEGALLHIRIAEEADQLIR